MPGRSPVKDDGAPSESLFTTMPVHNTADVELQCHACGNSFVFTAGEQELLRLRGVSATPEHCPTCTRSRRPGTVEGLTAHR